MIEQIAIGNVTSYGAGVQTFGPLKPINFVYGANGSGKTTISRIIDAEAGFTHCLISWAGGNALETLVYNRHFVEQNFHPELRGIFTLGEADAAIIQQIEEATKRRDELQKELQAKGVALSGEDGNGGKKGELASLTASFTEQCWVLKGKYDATFKAAFTGSRNSKVDFAARLEKEAQDTSAALHDLDTLKKRAATVFADNLTKFPAIAPLVYDDLVRLESDEVLPKKVIGKEDVDIAAMIRKLGNSDWVKSGRPYYEANDGYCPFCQQETPPSLADSLNAYFDETYVADMAAIDALATNYAAYSQAVLAHLEGIIGNPPAFLDCEALRVKYDLLGTKIGANRQHIARKRSEASVPVSLEALGDLLREISSAIEEANAKITTHNATVDNIANEKKILIAEIWRFVVDEAKVFYDPYKAKKAQVSDTIEKIGAAIKDKENELKAKKDDIRELEKGITSIQPTIDAINKILVSFGFTGFYLAKSEKEGHYKIVRPDGAAANASLSEGEKTFITFLYFYHRLKGSMDQSGVMTNRVVVFDDPVSSLDSDVLFIVSNLIKGIFDEIRSGASPIKQCVVLTHNVYFHKEISFHKKRSGNGDALNDETFWIVKKKPSGSVIENHPRNPIRTSYELLWSEVRSEAASSLSIQNTMRRILENYFKIMGSISPDDTANKFEGQEKMIYRSLMSWINDGSHFASDDMYISCDDETIEKYKSVFKRIFEVEGHEAHYNMMMRVEA